MGVEEFACRVLEFGVMYVYIYGVREWATDFCSWVCYKCAIEGLEPI